MKHVLLLTIVLAGLVSGHAASAATARGTVFEDTNMNGARDPDEPGIAGVRVSNGEDVVETDADGRWQLAVDGDAVLFVTKPADYMTPVDGSMLPQFYYLHRPNGSPGRLRYAGISPTGDLPAAIDFALVRRPEPRQFAAILFADTQPQTEAEVDYIRDDVVAELIGTDASFGMTMGDVFFDDLSLVPRLNAVIGQIGIPWYNVPGNHELNLLAEGDAYSLESFSRFYGPPYYSFEYGDALFVVLDNIDYQGRREITAENPRGNGRYEARLGKRQLRWLKNELSFVDRDRLVFLTMHAPLGTYRGSEMDNRRDLFRLLEGRPNLYAVAGHTHTTEHHYFGEEDGFGGAGTLHHHVLATVSGSWWSGPFDARGIPTSVQRDGTPKGYHRLEVDGTDLRVGYRASGKPAGFQMRIMFDAHHAGLRKDGLRDARMGELFDGRISVDQVAATQVVVNLFDGGPKSRLWMRVGGRSEQPLERVYEIDPFANEVLLRNPDTKKSWVNALPSSHLWKADLPDDLGPGTYTVSVRAVDEFGAEHHGHAILEVAGSSAPAAGSRYR